MLGFELHDACCVFDVVPGIRLSAAYAKLPVVPIAGLFRVNKTEYSFFCVTVCSSYQVNSLLLLLLTMLIQQNTCQVLMPNVKKLVVAPVVMLLVRQLSVENLAQSVPWYLSVHIPQEVGLLKRKKPSTVPELDMRLHMGMEKHSTGSCSIMN